MSAEAKKWKLSVWDRIGLWTIVAVSLLPLLPYALDGLRA
jgi:hypothetical protein